MSLLKDEDHEAARSCFNNRNIFEDDYICLANANWKKINEFCRKGLFCDVDIECRDGILHAHKCILSAASPYFMTLFTSPLSSTEGRQTVDFKSYASKTVNSILECIYNYYNYKMEEATDVGELLHLAEFIQLDILVKELIESIRNSADLDNCFEWCKIAKGCGVDKAFVVARSCAILDYDYIKEHPHLTKNLQEVLPTDDPVFQEEIILGACFKSTRSFFESTRSFCVVSVASNAVEDLEDKYRFYWHDSRHFSFFVHEYRLFSLSVAEVKRNNGEGFLKNYWALDNSSIIRVKEFDQLSGGFDDHREYDLEIKAESLFSKNDAHDLVSLNSSHFFNWYLASVFYDNVKSLFMVICIETRERSHIIGQSNRIRLTHRIIKIDLEKMSVLDNWVTLEPKCNNNILIAKSKAHGIILINDLHEVYTFENFDFQSNSNNSSHSAVPLNVTSDGNRKSKRLKLHPSELDERSWFSVSHDDKVFLMGMLGADPVLINVYVLDEVEKRWTRYCDVDVPQLQEIDSLFQYQGKVFISLVIAEEVEHEEGDKEVEHEEGDKKEKLNVELHEFKIKEKLFSKVMDLPHKHIFSIIPKYFLY